MRLRYNLYSPELKDKGVWVGQTCSLCGGDSGDRRSMGLLRSSEDKNALWRESKTLSHIEGGPRPRPLKTSYRLSRA